MFDAEDFTSLIKGRRADLFNRSMLLAQRFDSTETSMKLYSRQHAEFQAYLRPFASVAPGGNEVITLIPAEHAAEAHIRRYELDHLILQIIDFCNEDMSEAKSLCKEVSDAAKTYFADPKFFALEMVEQRADKT